MSPPTSFPIIVCRGDDYRSASEGLACIRDDAGEVHSALLRTLSGYGGMGGSDDAGAQWAKSYDEAVDAALQTSSKLVSTCARTSDLIAAGAHNHAVAEATANGVTPPPTPVPGFDPCLAIVSPSAGGGGPEPFGWSLIKSVSGLVWPDGHQDQLRAAKDVWSAAAEALDNATGRFPQAVGLLENQQSTEIPAAVASCSDTSTNFIELQGAYREIGDACGEYAQHLDDAHHEILAELKKMLIETAAIEAGMAVLVPFTGGCPRSATGRSLNGSASTLPASARSSTGSSPKSPPSSGVLAQPSPANSNRYWPSSANGWTKQRPSGGDPTPAAHHPA